MPCQNPKRAVACASLLAMLALLCGCGIDSAPPHRSPAPATPAVPSSTITASLVVPASQITRLANNATEYQLADIKDKPIKCGPLSCRLDLHAERTGPLSVQGSGDTLDTRIPFRTQAAISSRGFLSFLHGQAEGAGVIETHSRIAISPTLQLNSVTNGTVTLDNGHLRVGPVVTNIAQLWNDNEDSLSRPLWRALDKQVAKLPLRPRVARFWADAFRPIRASRSPATWLVLRPEKLAVAEPQWRDGALVLSLALTGRAQMKVQDAPPDNAPAPLPRAGSLQSPAGAFSVAVPVLLPYDRAAELALAALQKKPPRLAGLAVTFSRLEFLPSGQDIIVTTRLCADPKWDLFGWFASCGDVSLRGVPVFDAAQKVIRVDGLRYDVGSAGPVLQAIGALGRSDLTRLLQSKLVFHEAGPIDHLEDQIVQLLAKPQGREVSVSAHVETLDISSFTWTADGFWALVSAKGQVSATLNL